MQFQIFILILKKNLQYKTLITQEMLKEKHTSIKYDILALLIENILKNILIYSKKYSVNFKN